MLLVVGCSLLVVCCWLSVVADGVSCFLVVDVVLVVVIVACVGCSLFVVCGFGVGCLRVLLLVVGCWWLVVGGWLVVVVA